MTALSYGNGVSMNITGFNNKLQATGFEVKKGANKYIDKQYKFYEDGSLKFVDDGLDETFDCSYKYDALGRTVEGKAGIAARGTQSQTQHKLNQPYSMTYTHDAFGHLTGKTGYYYGSEDNTSYYYNSNNRNPSWGYDADGNITSDADAVYTYDAAGRIVKTNTTDDYFDGDGQLIKRVANAGSTTAPVETKSYFIRSSALGKVISEADATGKKQKTFVPANGTTLATQILHTSTNPPTEVMTFNHTDASGTGAQQTTASGALNGDTTYNRTGEYTPLGRNINHAGPYTTLSTSVPPEFGAGVNLFPSAEGYRPGRNEFTLEGIPVPESAFQNVINSGFVGGAFGLLAYSVRMSVRDYSVRFNDGNMQLERFFGSEGDAKNFAFRMNQTTVFKNILVSDAWSVLLAIAVKTGSYEFPRRLTPDEVDKLGGSVEKLVQQEECARFIEKLLNTALEIAKEKETFEKNLESKIMNIFDAVKKGGGFSIGNAYNTKRGSILYGTQKGAKAPEVQLDFSYYFPSDSDSIEFYKEKPFMKSGRQSQIEKLFNSNEGGFTTLHELIHFNFHDLTLASAVARLKGEDDKFKSLSDKSVTQQDVGNASQYWDAELADKCKLK